MKEDYLDVIEQKFNTQEEAQQFISIMSKYINPEQITIEGTKVSVKAVNRGESWFLLFFTLLVATKKAGVETPSSITESATLLASNLGTPKVDEILDDLEKRGLTQSQLLDLISDFSC